MLLIPYTCPKASNVLREKVLAPMKNDEISFKVQKDELILMFGSALMEKGGSKQCHYISQRMRQLSRLLIKLNERQEGSLESFLKPASFDIVLSAVKELCEFSYGTDGSNSVKIPSLALKLGHSLNKCLLILKAKLLEREMMGSCKTAEMY